MAAALPNNQNRSFLDYHSFTGKASKQRRQAVATRVHIGTQPFACLVDDDALCLGRRKGCRREACKQRYGCSVRPPAHIRLTLHQSRVVRGHANPGCGSGCNSLTRQQALRLRPCPCQHHRPHQRLKVAPMLAHIFVADLLIAWTAASTTRASRSTISLRSARLASPRWHSQLIVS